MCSCEELCGCNIVTYRVRRCQKKVHPDTVRYFYYLFRWASYATSVLASLQIQFLSFVYARVVRRLNDFENYRTETAYENNLIFKTFLFQVWRSSSSLRVRRP